MTTHDSSPLGSPATYRNRYAPQLLYPIERSQGRAGLGIHGAPPFQRRGHLERLRAVLAGPARQAGGGAGRIPRAGRLAGHHRIQVLQAVPQQLQRRASGQRMPCASTWRATWARPPARRWPCTCAWPRRSPPSASRSPRATCIDALELDIDHYGPPRPGFPAGRCGRRAGRGNPAVEPAQVQLPGHRPAGLGQRAHRLRRRRRSTAPACCATWSPSANTATSTSTASSASSWT